MRFDRSGGARPAKQRVSRDFAFSGPNKGLVKSGRVGRGPDGAADVLQNFFPTIQGGRPRGGSATRATLPTAVKHLTTYETTIFKMFGATNTAIYDVTAPADPLGTPAAAVTGLTSGDWSSLQFQAAGASYLLMVNGVDDWREFDGTTWAVRNAGSTPSITGVLTSKLSQLWSYGKRVFAIQKDSMSAWYLPVLSRSGAMTEFPMGSVFSLGGSLLFGGTWSVNTGAGLSENCAFVTTKGEVAIYQGVDPASWTLVNVYRLGAPLHKNAHFKAGGDLAIMTEDGIESVSAAMTTDQNGLPQKAITVPIHDEWLRLVKERLPAGPKFNCTMWTRESMLVVGIPLLSGTETKLFAANAITGAWAPFTAWDVACSVVFNSRFYFGSNDGKIREGDVGGMDDNVPYHCIYVPAFNDMGKPNEKVLLRARCWAKANQNFTLQLFGSTNYSPNIPVPQAADTASGGTLWGTAIWGDTGSVWGSSTEAKLVQSKWQTISGIGTEISVGVSFLSGAPGKPVMEIIKLDVVYEDGQVMG
jgi:hypothetical protein